MISKNPSKQLWLFKSFRIGLSFVGIVFTFLIVLSFTSIPYWAYYGLSLPSATTSTHPDHIVCFSGEGMPSPQTLMRVYTTCTLAQKFPDASIIMAYPTDTLACCKTINRLKKEFSQRGVSLSKIRFETQGVNTHTQAKNLSGQFLSKKSEFVLIVSSPEYIYRTVHCFKKLGYNNVISKAAFPQIISNNALKGEGNLPMLSLRYNMWNYLKYEITVLREYTAIVYYKLKGWI